MTTQYVSSVAYAAVSIWTANTTLAAGSIIRQAGTVTQGQERCFRTANGGKTGSAQPAWVLTAGGASPTDGTITDWVEVTGQQAYQVSGGAWNAPHARLTNALASGWAAAGDAIYVRSDHAETYSGSLGIVFPGTYAAFNICQCVQVNCAIPPGAADAATGASITSTTQGCSIGGAVWWDGISPSVTANYTSFSFTGTTGRSLQCFNNCTVAAPQVGFGGSGTAGEMSRVRLNNVLFQQNANPNAGGYFIFANADEPMVEWYGGGFTGTARTSPIFADSSSSETMLGFNIRNVDFSFFGAGYTLAAANASSSIHHFLFEKCKFNPAMTFPNTPLVPGTQLDFIGCDFSGGSNSLFNARYDYSGTLTTDFANYQAAGASAAGTPFSWNIVTNANCSMLAPFETFIMAEFYVGTVGSPISQKFDIMTDGAVVTTPLTNRDVQVDLEYFGSATSTLGSVITSGVANILTPGTTIPTGSVNSWTTSGITTPQPQEITLTWTPQEVGYYRAVLKVNKPSLTLWTVPPAAKAQ